MIEVGRHERIWVFYVATVVTAVAVSGLPVGPGRGDVRSFVAIQLAVGAAALILPRLFIDRRRLAIARGVFSTVGLGIVFSSLAMVLPAIHPEPYEFTWIGVDRAVFGTDPTVALQAILWPPFVEVLQFCYAIFYAVPIVAVLAAARRGGIAVYEASLDLIVFGFALSYIGYLLWPTLPPYRFLWHDVPIRGVLWAGAIHEALDAAEIHKWNCFPSGHTMLSVLSLVVVWRHARRAFYWLLIPVALLVLATVALRYHYVVDVAAGLVGVPVTLWLDARLRGGAARSA